MSVLYCCIVLSFAQTGEAGSFRYAALIEPFTVAGLERATAMLMNTSVAETEFT
jgi:hypothetical protein